MGFNTNPAFVFIHGAWHNHHTWDKVVAELARRGYGSVAIDLPGAGKNSRQPLSFFKRPLDLEQFATEPSPNAGITQDERNEATIAAVNRAAEIGNGRVILLGHSLGGLTITPVTELIPDQIDAVVYLAAFMLPNGMSNIQLVQSGKMQNSQVRSLFLADPPTVGAQRIDVNSSIPDYMARIVDTFYADVSDEDLRFILSHLHCDEPASIAPIPSTITKEKFGTVDRHYIRCLQDKAMTLDVQDYMIGLVDAEMGNMTQTHTLDASHSPFLSAVEPLIDILVSIAS